MVGWDEYFPPQAVGKFCSQDDLQKILGGASLLWSRPSRFNDPFDCNPHFKFPNDAAKLHSAIMREFDRALMLNVPYFSCSNALGKATCLLVDAVQTGKISYSEVELMHHDNVRDFLRGSASFLAKYRDDVVLNLQSSKILCLTKAFDETLMWSHYAGNHSGALVVFSPITDDSQFSIAKPVAYSEVLPDVISIESLAKLISGQISATDSEYVGEAYDQITMTKAKSWQYEKEWRIVGGDGFDPEKEVELNRFSMDDVVAIVFGVKFPQDTMEMIIKTASGFYSCTNWYKSCVSQSRFGLDLVPV